MAKTVTEEDLLSELITAYLIPVVTDDDITSLKLHKEVLKRGGKISQATIEKDMLIRVKAGEFTIERKRSPNGKLTNVYVKVRDN